MNRPTASHPDSLGGYRIVGVLGEGGMGVVYRAHDDKLGRSIALKTMRPEIAKKFGAVQRFLREARAAACIEHDNVIPIWQVGEDAGIPFIAMPLLRGESLDARLQREAVQSLGVTLKVGREVAEGLAAAHDKGLIHRDIKPANIWLEGDLAATDPAVRFRRVKLLDFGLARAAQEDIQLSREGAVIGTPAYMSPEQSLGKSVDHRTDLFSLGVLLYRLLTGEPPFDGPTVAVVLVAVAVVHPPPPAAKNPAVPPALSDFVMRLLSKDAAHRPGSAKEVATALREIGRELAARKSTPTATAPALPVPPPVVETAVVPEPPTVSEPPASRTIDRGRDATLSSRPRRRPTRRHRRRRSGAWWKWLATLSLAAVVVGVIVTAINRRDRQQTAAAPKEPSAEPQENRPAPKPTVPTPPLEVPQPRDTPPVAAPQPKDTPPTLSPKEPPKEPPKDPLSPPGDKKDDPNAAPARSLRWTIRFRTANGKDYLNQLAATGAAIVIPHPTTKQMVYIPDLNRLQIRREPTDSDRQQLRDRVQFTDSRPESVKQVAGTLGLNFTPTSFAAFFPQRFEEELARKEKEFRGADPKDIKETVFSFAVKGKKPDVTIVEQHRK